MISRVLETAEPVAMNSVAVSNSEGPSNEIQIVGKFLGELFQGDVDQAIALLELMPEFVHSSTGSALLRVASLKASDSALYYQRLFNLWKNAGYPDLKPNVTQRKVLLLSDLTMDHVLEPFQISCAARGVPVSLALSAFDSVEQEILNPDSFIYQKDFDIVIVTLSNDWLDRYLGDTSIVPRARLEQTQSMLAKLFENLLSANFGQVLVTNWAQPAYPTPGGLLSNESGFGRRLAGLYMNTWLNENARRRLNIVDTDTAIHLAGGLEAVGQRSYWLARMPFEASGTLAVARELASAVASCLGQSHRALITDWDNTIWGGEIAELGSFDVICGYDSAEANAYRVLQIQFRGIAERGVLLGAVTRNDPSVASLIDENPEIPLDTSSFATIRAAYQPKSRSISEVAEDLGFGPEYMLYVDDSLYELSEVLLSHPYIDILHAGPEPDQTLSRFVRDRYFNDVAVSDEDLARKDAAKSLKRQREAAGTFATHEKFLESINISIHIAPYGNPNRRRILQMLYKTNQFNLTTRRHTEAEIAELLEQGAEIWSFAYEDSFGPQGIIAAVIIVPDGKDHVIDSWVMSCRVLNRTVEQAMFCWIEQNLDYSRLVGEYRPSAKNSLVAELYPSLGFEPCEERTSADSAIWHFSRGQTTERPDHYIKQFILD
jgi:FkbH-like protein